MVGQPGGHGGRHSERPMDAGVVVEHEMDRDRMHQVLHLLGEGVG